MTEQKTIERLADQLNAALAVIDKKNKLILAMQREIDDLRAIIRKITGNDRVK